MSLVVENPHADAARRERTGLAEGNAKRTGKSLPKGKTALALNLSDFQISWLAQYATDQWNAYHSALGGWRTKLKKFERMAESDRSDRQGAPNPKETTAPKSIFDHSNRSLGLVSGFADFAFAQARDDIFGTSPYFAATPEGMADEQLASDITRHAHWKFSHTSFKDCCIDSLRLACDLGTAFPKLSWRKEIEQFSSIKQVAHDEAGNPILKADGSYATPDDEEAAIAASWKEMLVDDQLTVFDNLEARCIDFNDIAFNPTAPTLDLLHTDVFHRFQIGLLDAKQIYGLTDEQYEAALTLIRAEPPGANTPREHRNEATPVANHALDEDANPPITLVEGYMRVNPLGKKGTPIRMWVIFSPLLQTIFTLDYLANQTPGGILPIHAIPWFKTANRIVGKGYYERFEDVDTFIDEQFNLTVHRDRLAADPIGGYDPEVFDEDMEEGDVFTIHPGILKKLKPGAKLDDGLQFVKPPDANFRAIDLMQQMMQVAQLRTGITSASQGELSGVPEVNTATGVNQIISRGATLLKWPIDTIKDALAGPLDTAIQLLYANQDTDETFTWSEGRAPELVEIKRNDVRGLRLNVRFSMTQSQNQSKLQNAQAAIQFIQQYLGLPEPEKVATRSVFIQALQALGFQGADQIVREPITDAMAIAAMLPPELQQPFLMFAQQMGLIAPPAPEDGTAPPESPENAIPGEPAAPPLSPPAAA